MNTEIITIPFHGQNLTTAVVNNVPYIAMKPVCENLGMDWEGQRQRINRHPILSSTAVMIKAVAEDGKEREMIMLPITNFNGWLFGVDAERVNPEIRSKVLDYQRECFAVLANHFMPNQRQDVERLEELAKTQKLLIDSQLNEIAYVKDTAGQAVGHYKKMLNEVNQSLATQLSHNHRQDERHAQELRWAKLAQRPIQAAEKGEIAEAFKQGMTVPFLAQRHDRSPSIIRRTLREAGLIQ